MSVRKLWAVVRDHLGRLRHKYFRKREHRDQEISNILILGSSGMEEARQKMLHLQTEIESLRRASERLLDKYPQSEDKKP